MNPKIKTLLSVLLFLSIAASALWMVERNEASALARELEAVQSKLADAKALNSGVEEANRDLRAQVRTLRNAPPMFTVGEPGDDLASSDGIEDDEPSREAWNPGRSESRPEAGEENLTPEEIAERAEREAQRQAWREEREKRREEFRVRVSEDIQTRKEFFAQVSTQGQAPEYKQAHEQLMVSLDDIQILMDQLGNPELDRDQRRELMRTMFATTREVRGLMDMQRDVLINDYAQSIGLGGEQTREIIEYMRTVNDMTNPVPMGGGRGR